MYASAKQGSNLKSLIYNVKLFQSNTLLVIILISNKFPRSSSQQNKKMTYKKDFYRK